jgi:hypothetical protein
MKIEIASLSDRWRRAFSLMEVMIAIAIFFMVSFSILAVVSAGLRTAQALRITRPNAGILAADLTLTNRLEEGEAETGDFEDLCPKMYPDYEWTRKASELGTNGLWQVDFTIYRRDDRSRPDSTLSILLYSPQSQPRRLRLAHGSHDSGRSHVRQALVLVFGDLHRGRELLVSVHRNRHHRSADGFADAPRPVDLDGRNVLGDWDDPGQRRRDDHGRDRPGNHGDHRNDQRRDRH